MGNIIYIFLWVELRDMLSGVQFRELNKCHPQNVVREQKCGKSERSIFLILPNGHMFNDAILIFAGLSSRNA
jgi:hypothetical protein